MIKLSFNTIMYAINNSNALAEMDIFNECFIVTFDGHQSEATEKAFCDIIKHAVYFDLQNKNIDHKISRYEDVNVLVKTGGVYEYPVVQYGFNEDDELEVESVAWVSNFRGKMFQVSQTIDGQRDMGSSEPVGFDNLAIDDYLKSVILKGQHDSAILRYTKTSYFDDRYSIASTMVFMQGGMRDNIVKAIINHKN